MASTPNFAATALAPDVVQISTANTARNGTGTVGTLTTGTVNGVVIEKITVKAAGSTTAGCIRFFISTNSGTDKRLIAEVSVSAITASASLPAYVSLVPQLNGLVLVGTSSVLYCSTEKAETFNVIVEKSGL